MDDNAVTQVIAFLVGGTVFVAALGALLLATRDAGQADDVAVENAEADRLANLLVGSAGLGWEAGPDGVVRLGLAASNGTGLDSSSLQALRGGQFEPTANGKVDYEEARSSLGITGDFHLRMYPVGLGSTFGQADLSGTRTAYVGDWTNLNQVTVAVGSDADMIAAAQAEFNATMAFLTGVERQIVVDIGLGFDNGVHINTGMVMVDLPVLPDVPLLTALGDVTLAEGDVYPDDKPYLSAVLPSRLPSYDVLVVGSGVAHSSLTANAVKSAIETFVLDGGTLIVFGSNGQNFQWLQPLFDVGQTSVNGGAYAPDVNHPALREPHELAWTGYDTQGLAWDIKSQGSGAHYDDFDHVIVADDEDILAISNVGAFGEGRIFLTSFQPALVAADLGFDEGRNFVDNVVLYFDRAHLYLEYGPTIPANAEVASTVRQSFVYDEHLGQVPVRFEILTWN